MVSTLNCAWEYQNDKVMKTGVFYMNMNSYFAPAYLNVKLIQTGVFQMNI